MSTITMQEKLERDEKTYDSLHKRDHQKRRILNLLYVNETLSGSVVCRNLGVSLPTALILLNELIDSGFVENRGLGMSKGGRKPNLYGLSKHSILVLVCELGRYLGKLTIYNAQNKPVSPVVEFETFIDDENLVEKIYKNSQRLFHKNKINEDKVLAVGLTMPGLIDVTEGINYTIKNPHFRNVESRLREKFNKLIYVNNDARMQAYGEYKFGAARGNKNAVIVNWDWGIGIGMILNGKLYNGASGYAGEISHAKFVEDGDLCICGKRGCLETLTSVQVLIDRARTGIKSGIVSQLTKKFENRLNYLEAVDIIASAKAGDEFSISLLNSVGLALGEGLSVTIQLLNPDIIVLGGIMSRANQFILTPIQQSLNKYCLEQMSENTKIVISENWEQSGLLGITAMLFQKLFIDMYK